MIFFKKIWIQKTDIFLQNLAIANIFKNRHFISNFKKNENIPKSPKIIGLITKLAYVAHWVYY